MYGRQTIHGCRLTRRELRELVRPVLYREAGSLSPQIGAVTNKLYNNAPSCEIKSMQLRVGRQVNEVLDSFSRCC